MQTTDDILFSAHGPDPIPTATTEVVGTPGNALNVYWIVSHFPIGSVVSGPFPQKSAPNVLDDENYVHISWLPTLGATSYDLLFTEDLELPQQPGRFALALGLTETEFRDRGQSLSFYDVAGIRYGAPQQEWIFFDNRDRKQPTLRFIPWPIEVSSIIFEDGSSLSTAGAAGGAAPPNMSVQFNNNGAFGGSPNLIWDNINDRMLIQGHVGISDPNPVAAKLSVVNDSATGLRAAGISSSRFSDDTVPPIFYSFKARGSYANRQPVQTGDELLYLGYGGYVPGFEANHGAITAPVGTDIRSADMVFFTNDGTNNIPNANGYERMRITSIGNVGIGTDNPQATLDVIGTIRAVTTPSANVVQGIFLASTQSRAFLSGGNYPSFHELDITADPLLLNRRDLTTGLVGIGVFNPKFNLDVQDTIDIVQVSRGATLSFSHSGVPFADQRIAIIGTDAEFADGSAALFFETANLGVMAERMRIDTQGNVGIGTTNPQATLDVNGIIHAENVNMSFLSGAGSGMWLSNFSTPAQCFVGMGAFLNKFVVWSVPLSRNILTLDITDGSIAVSDLPSSDPGGGSKQLWYDPSDNNRVKFAA